MEYRETRIALQYAETGRSWQSCFSRRRFLAAGFGFLASAHGFPANGTENALSFLAEGAAAEDGYTLRLADGRRVRLPDILPPGPDRHAPMSDTHPLRQAARSLGDLILGQRLRVDLEDPAEDRYGRLRARVSVADLDVAEDLCRQGWVRVFPEPGADPKRIETLLAAEAEGRSAGNGQGRGLWGSGFFRLWDAEPYAGGVDRFEIATGTVTEVKEIGTRLHLGFGADWRRDLTVGIPKPAVRRMVKAGFDPSLLSGQGIEARGWVREWNGPFLEPPDPSAIRLRPAGLPDGRFSSQ